MKFEENSILIVRKGLKEQFVYFNDEVAQVLREYIEIERTKYIPFTEEKALFLSTQKQGISVRTIQQMVKKYSKEIVINKSLSPHKMRSTYGTALYNKTGDIRLVADVLGHSDINTPQNIMQPLRMNVENKHPECKFTRNKNEIIIYLIKK